ncbi:hypothetical protein HX794_02675 [Pseudomonas costantinii]|uniref:phage tail fiber domain-containing protein n=1 Tax=Pseudomonas costantinii TaxID=168469 RepID=UPI00159F83A9|nr:phage tail fiber protein [Pseudomonas costantinii]NVZ18541.1 hypothetical protein [Pseudomonas costantinii]
MAAPKTVLTYPLNGAQKDFSIPFEYLARKFVTVTLIGKTRKALTLNSDYRFTARTTITTTKAWGPGDLFTSIELRRVTSATERLVDFADGSILRAYDLNTAQVQSLHIAEEARDLTADTLGVNNDGDLDARGRKIVNVADGALDGDAVNMGQTRRWSESALNQANRSEQQATLANNARINAENAQINAQTAAGQSAGSRDIALNAATRAAESRDISSQAMVRSESARDRSETAAVNSQNSNVNSTDQANRSQREADRAKTEADKLGNWNALASTVDSVNGVNVSWQGNGTWRGGEVAAMSDGDANFAYKRTDGSVGMRMTRDNQHNWLLVDDTRGRIRINSDTVGNMAIPGSYTARGGSISVQAAATGQNAHMWLQSPDGTERALLWADGGGTLYLRAAQGPQVAVYKDGRTEFPNTLLLANTASITTDGDIHAPWLRSGHLSSALASVKQGTRIRNVPTVIWERGVDTSGGSGDQGAPGSTMWLREPLMVGDFYMFEIYGAGKFYSTTNCTPYGDSATEEHNVQFDSGGAMRFVLTEGGQKITVRSSAPNNQYGIRRVFLFKLQLS